MVLFVLYMKADLENVEKIEIPPHHQWCLDVKQPNSDEERKGVFVSDEEEYEVENSRGKAHFLMKWPGAKKESQMDVVKELKKFIKSSVTKEDSGEFVPIVGFECRGIEPIRWNPTSGYIVTSLNESATFDNADFSDDWVEYDTEGDQSVGVYNIEYKFEVHK